MNVLYLGPERPVFEKYFHSVGDSIKRYEETLTPDNSVLQDVEFIVSYGYQKIIKQNVLDLFVGRVINLHISLLPWNRGADPNFWSFIEHTPKGVTIHQIEAGIDTGAILVQKEVSFTEDETLRTSYAKLSSLIEKLFYETWPKIRNRKITPRPQPQGGSFHKPIDKKPYEYLLSEGWDTHVRKLMDIHDH